MRVCQGNTKTVFLQYIYSRCLNYSRGWTGLNDSGYQLFLKKRQILYYRPLQLILDDRSHINHIFVQFCLIELTVKKKINRSSLSSPLKVVETMLLNALYNEIKLNQKAKPMKNWFQGILLKSCFYHHFTAQGTHIINQNITSFLINIHLPILIIQPMKFRRSLILCEDP